MEAMCTPQKKRALLIGCSKYKDERKNLPAAQADVNAFKNVLVNHWGFLDNGEDIKVLIDEGIIDIENAFEELFEEAKAT